jgi:phage tail sheath gpL-like
MGSMIYGMLRATQLLGAYADLGWIRHPDVSSALVVASLKREGKAVTKAVEKLNIDAEQITKNKKAVEKVTAELKNLKNKNSNWNT